MSYIASHFIFVVHRGQFAVFSSFSSSLNLAEVILPVNQPGIREIELPITQIGSEKFAIFECVNLTVFKNCHSSFAR
jgi:hypothetical protein